MILKLSGYIIAFVLIMVPIPLTAITTGVNEILPDRNSLAPISSIDRNFQLLLEVAALEKIYGKLSDLSESFDGQAIQRTREKFIIEDGVDPYPAVNPNGENNVYGIVGYPMVMDSAMSVNIAGLREYLRTDLGLSPDTLFLLPEQDLHNTVFRTIDPYAGSGSLTPEEKITRLHEIHDALNDVKEFQIRFDRIIVTKTGEILVAGIPLDYEYFRVRHQLDKGKQAIVHLSLGRFINVPQRARSEIAEKLNAWLVQRGGAIGLQTVTRDSWKVCQSEVNWYCYDLRHGRDYRLIDELGTYLEHPPQEASDSSSGVKQLEGTTSRGIKVILFDLDDTLYSCAGIKEMYREAFVKTYAEKYSVPYEQAKAIVEGKRQEILRKRNGPVSDNQVALELGVSWEEKEQGELRYLPFSEIKRDQSLRTRLNGLAQQGYVLGIATNCSRKVADKILRCIGIGDCFRQDRILTRESLGTTKPDPAFFRSALARLSQSDTGGFNAEPSQIIYVGDDPQKDIKPAEHFGMWSLRVSDPSDIHQIGSRLDEINRAMRSGRRGPLPVSIADFSGNMEDVRKALQDESDLTDKEKLTIAFHSNNGVRNTSFFVPKNLLKSEINILARYFAAVINNEAMTQGVKTVSVFTDQEFLYSRILQEVNEHFPQFYDVTLDYYGYRPIITRHSNSESENNPSDSTSYPSQRVEMRQVAKRGNMIGINIGQTNTKTALVHDGRFVEDSKNVYSTWGDIEGKDIDTLFDMLNGEIQRLHDFSRQQGLGPIHGIGISVGGIVCNNRMTTRSGIAAGLDDASYGKLLRITDILSKKWQVPVILEQDVVSKTIGIASETPLEKTLILDIGTSLGGCYVDPKGNILELLNQVGRVCADISSTARVRSDGKGKGALSDLLSAKGLEYFARQRGVSEKAKKIVESFSNDERARMAVEDLGEILIRSVVLLLQYYDFDTVVLSGGIFENEEVKGLLISTIGRAIPQIKFEMSPLGGNFDAAIGAAQNLYLHQPKLSFSCLGVEGEQLKEELLGMSQSGIDMVHIDYIDNSFVPGVNEFDGRNVIKMMQQEGLSLPRDIHLMAKMPSESLVQSFIDAGLVSGRDRIVVHWEAFDTVDDLLRILNYIKSKGLKAGVALKTTTDVSELSKILDKIDLDTITLMGIEEIGKNGQEFSLFVFTKITTLKTILAKMHSNAEIIIDGGSTNEIMKRAIKLGVSTFVLRTVLVKPGKRPEDAVLECKQLGLLPYSSLNSDVTEDLEIMRCL